MFSFSIAIVIGLIILVWSADRFVDGASRVASHFGMSPLLIGMVVIGFGTSAPEMVVSSLASLQGSPGIALGNAYGSNITNIALILGITAIYRPISVHSTILKKELPILSLVTILTIVLIYDLELSLLNSVILLFVFSLLVFWSIRAGLKNNKDALALEVNAELNEKKVSLNKSIANLVIGLIILILSSRLLVWGAIGIAKILGVSDIIVGLTVVAVGTSLPELASSIIAAKKGESDLALGNILGSNLFNTLAVVGIAGAIHPFSFDQVILYRDVFVMGGLTLILFIFGYGFKGQGRINRFEGGLLLFSYLVYTTYLIKTTLS